MAITNTVVRSQNFTDTEAIVRAFSSTDTETIVRSSNFTDTNAILIQDILVVAYRPTGFIIY